MEGVPRVLWSLSGHSHEVLRIARLSGLDLDNVVLAENGERKVARDDMDDEAVNGTVNKRGCKKGSSNGKSQDSYKEKVMVSVEFGVELIRNQMGNFLAAQDS
ncbi:hypothetical protein SESBI_41003 [Sesbania bispinosa]|nr:hypothetical protein SESBI_41003 [Sesbania bispinosa]